ncbi:MAG TPA: hypothetical protein VGF94_30130 [Kofleriaceae bacterium]
MTVVLAACAGTLPSVHSREARTYSEIQHDIAVHDQLAAEHEQAETQFVARGPRAYSCPDPVLNDQIRTGGIGVTTWQPCVDIAMEARAQEHALAMEQRELARRDRVQAGKLLDAVNTACAGVPEAERDGSLFAQHDVVARVRPAYQSGALSGVWIDLAPRPGLDAKHVSAALQCERTRSTLLGYRADVDARDPAVVPGAQFQVFQRPDHVEILVTAPTRDAAELALERATNANAG